MRIRWRFAPVMVFFFGEALSGSERATDVGRLRDWVRQLGSDRYTVRRDAERALSSQTALVVPLLEQELAGASHLEQRLRLERVIAGLRRLPWRHDLAAAQAEARATRKPLLVFSTRGDPCGFG